MIPHWDLCPGETVTLVSPSGARVEAVYETSDTLHRYFRAEGTLLRFGPLRNGDLIAGGRRWTTDGEPRNTRGEISERVGRT